MRKVNGVGDASQLKDSTRDMRTCYATRLTEPTHRCQISHIVVDSGWNAGCS